MNDYPREIADWVNHYIYAVEDGRDAIETGRAARTNCETAIERFEAAMIWTQRNGANTGVLLAIAGLLTGAQAADREIRAEEARQAEALAAARDYLARHDGDLIAAILALPR